MTAGNGHRLTGSERMPNEAEALPSMLRVPLAIADDLLDPAAMKSGTTADSADLKLVEKPAAETEPNGEPARSVRVVFHILWVPG